MINPIRAFVIFMILCCQLFFGGCGGSSDREGSCKNCPGIGGEEGPEGIRYIGRAAFATPDKYSIQPLTGGAFAGGRYPGLDIPKIEAGNLRTLRLPLILSNSADVIDIASPPYGSRSAYRKVRTDSGTQDGACGGRIDYFLNISDEKREFSGSFTYSNYCDRGITISGIADVEGTLDNSGQFETIDFLFSSLSDNRVQMDGEISIEFSDAQIECFMDFFAEDRASKKVYWINQYLVSIYEFSDQIEFDLHGNYYDPDYGYVNIATIEDFRILKDDNWPISGRLLIRGKANVTAELAALDAANCMIQADLDGDDAMDYISDTLSWETLVENSDSVQSADAAYFHDSEERTEPAEPGTVAGRG